MKKWQKIVGVIVFVAIGICLGCTRYINHRDGEKVKYSDFPKEVQDTLARWGEHEINTDLTVSTADTGCSISLGEHTINTDPTVSVELPDVICFKSDYSFLYSTFGPWIISRRLKRNTDGKEWKFSGNLNIPRPIVTIGDTIYIPSEYMLVSGAEIDDNAIFLRQILR